MVVSFELRTSKPRNIYITTIGRVSGSMIRQFEAIARVVDERNGADLFRAVRGLMRRNTNGAMACRLR